MKGHESDKRGMFSSVGPNGVRQGYRFCAFCAGGAVFLNPVSQSLIIDGSVKKVVDTSCSGTDAAVEAKVWWVGVTYGAICSSLVHILWLLSASVEGKGVDIAAGHRSPIEDACSDNHHSRAYSVRFCSSALHAWDRR